MIHDTILPYSTFRIINEVDLMTKVQGHHNVVQLKGMWRIRGNVILAMPYLHPCKFKELVAKIEVEEVKLYVANLMSALEHVHKLGIIHRDVKPDNFLYDRRVKKFSLIDFGLARLASQAGGSKETSPSAECDCLGQLTVCPKCESMPHLVVPIAGTPGYLAPESLLKFEEQTSAVDIWAAGVTMLCMLSRLAKIKNKIEPVDY